MLGDEGALRRDVLIRCIERLLRLTRVQDRTLPPGLRFRDQRFKPSHLGRGFLNNVLARPMELFRSFYLSRQEGQSLLRLGVAFERLGTRRTPPPRTPALP